MRESTRLWLLFSVSGFVYANTLLNGFTFDDGVYISNNPALTHPSISRFFLPTRGSEIFRPITFSTLALNWAIGGPQPIWYHLVNILLHALSVLLLYLLLRKLLETQVHAAGIAFAAALLFAVHPIHTEAVASIVGRAELLAAAFLLGGWLLHLENRQIPALICLVLAMMSKESAVAFLPLVLAGDYVRGKLKPLRQYGWIAGITLLYIGFFWKIEGGRFRPASVGFLDNPLADLPLGWRILNALRVAWKYVGIQAFPMKLSCDYSYNAIPLYKDWAHTIVAAVATTVALTLWMWAFKTSRNARFLGGAIYVAGFAVTSNIFVTTGTIMGERLAYLPSAGFCLLAAMIWMGFEKRGALPAWILLVLLACSLAVRTVARNRDWRDNVTLFSAASRVVPESARVHSNLGSEYLRSGQFDSASHELEMALRIYPNYPDAIENQGVLQAWLGHEPEALRLLDKALAMTSERSVDHDVLAVNLAAELMKVGENQEAYKLLTGVIEASSGYAPAWSNRAALRYQWREFKDARADVKIALQLDPDDARAQMLLRALNRADNPLPLR